MGFIDGMRGVAAFYVVIQHCCTLMDPYFRFQRQGAQPGWMGMIMAPFWYGHLAVAAFITISGFCLQWSLEERSKGKLTDYLKFMQRRCRRILPPYYACLAFSLLTCWLITSKQKGMPWAIYLPVNPENVLSHIFMIHNLRPDWMYKINGVLWSIAIEFQLYLLFPCLVILLNSIKKNVFIGFVLMSTVAISLTATLPVSKLYLWFIPLFFVGMTAARICKRPLNLALSKWSPYLGFGLVIVGVALQSVTDSIVIKDLSFGLGTAFLLLAGVAHPHQKWLAFFEWKPVLFVGTFSYSLYLMHHLVLQWAYAYRPSIVSTPVRELAYLVLVGIPIALVASYGFHLVFEKPFMTSKSKRKMST